MADSNPWASTSPWAEEVEVQPAPASTSASAAAAAAETTSNKPAASSSLLPPADSASFSAPTAETSVATAPPEQAEQSSEAAAPPAETSLPSTSSIPSRDGFNNADDDDDDFDFQEAVDPTSTSHTHDADFDDFGDFDDAAAIEAVAAPTADSSDFADEPAPELALQSPADAQPAPSQPAWSALPDPRSLTHDDLLLAIRQLLPHLSTAANPITPASQLPIKTKSSPHARLGMLALTPGAQATWDDLVCRPPKGYKPVSWARSGARRRLYTALGVPINLDEELPPSVTGSLPPLKISLGTENGAGSKARGPSVVGNGGPNSGRNTPQPSSASAARRTAQQQAQQAPPLDRARIEALLNLNPTQLSLLPLSAIRTLSAELKSHTAATSASLAYYLQRKDTLANDAETYNTMIRDLVAGAASRLASGGGGTGTSTPRNSTGPGAVGKGNGSVPSPTTAAPPGGWAGTRTPRSSTPLGR